jgi:putative FmdB family regulatory protein
MPIYEWFCAECGEIEVFRAFADYQVPPEHPHPVTRILSAPMVMADIQPYVAKAGDMAGKVIGSRREHKAFLKRNRLVEFGDAPIRDTRQMRRTIRRGEIREIMREAIAKHTVPDFKRGGLKERNA